MSESDPLERALEKVRADQSPKEELDALDPQERRMVEMAQLLRGSAAASPHPQFVQRVRKQRPPSPRVSRRAAVLSAFGSLAAGLVAGLGLGRHLPQPSRSSRPALVGANGRWVQVAKLAEVPPGTVRAFRAGAVQGFLLNRGGQMQALSRICTHMGCQLIFEAGEKAFVCPCHGAEFDLRGQLRYGPRGYGQALPPLPPIRTRLRGETVEVWTV